MKGKYINKARLAGAVMLATMGVAAGTAQAESLLAPLIINNTTATQNVETFLQYKVGFLAGAPLNKDGFATTHYHWIQKNWNDGNFFTGKPQVGNVIGNIPVLAAPDDVIGNYYKRPKKACRVKNDFGKMTPKDMIYQSTRAHLENGVYATTVIPSTNAASMAQYGITQPMHWDDQSSAPSWIGNFLGMLVIDDVSSGNDEEGNMSGFAYVVDALNGYMLDYKLINNHRSTKSGDFSAGFMSKKSIDYSWLPDAVAQTEWYTAVMSDDMTFAAEQNPGSVYDASVMIGSQPRDKGQSSPQEITKNSKGVFDHDENFRSGAPDYEVTCLSGYDRSAFLFSDQVIFTSEGGWTRRSITPWNEGHFSTASGALTYKLERSNVTIPQSVFRPVSWQVETSGHLSNGRSGNHANRPY